MVLLIQRLLDGVSNGFLYGAVALALVLIYRSTGRPRAI
jgi:branched-chain amino acid transport system permease protein